MGEYFAGKLSALTTTKGRSEDLSIWLLAKAKQEEAGLNIRSVEHENNGWGDSRLADCVHDFDILQESNGGGQTAAPSCHSHFDASDSGCA